MVLAKVHCNPKTDFILIHDDNGVYQQLKLVLNNKKICLFSFSFTQSCFLTAAAAAVVGGGQNSTKADLLSGEHVDCVHMSVSVCTHVHSPAERRGPG